MDCVQTGDLHYIDTTCKDYLRQGKMSWSLIVALSFLLNFFFQLSVLTLLVIQIEICGALNPDKIFVTYLNLFLGKSMIHIFFSSRKVNGLYHFLRKNSNLYLKINIIKKQGTGKKKIMKQISQNLRNEDVSCSWKSTVNIQKD